MWRSGTTTGRARSSSTSRATWRRSGAWAGAACRVSQTGRKFDMMFPTNYTVETMEKAGLVVNLNKDWIPNYVNIFGRTPTSFPDRFEPYRSDHRYVPDYPDYGGFNNTAQVALCAPPP